MSKRGKNIDKSKIITSIISIAIIICFMYVVNENYKRTYINEINNVKQNQATINEDTAQNQAKKNIIEQNQISQDGLANGDKSSNPNYDLSNIQKYTDKIWVEINNNIPYFTEEDKGKAAFEEYSELDDKERCGIAFANICKEIMPKEGQKREEISIIKPSGWKQTKIDGKYLYNRCHLIAYQLADESANEKNLITGTRYFNTEGMLPFENKVANYIKQNENNHVLYRVTPDFKGENLVASGVQIEAYSLEDNGNGIQFNVYIYNVQPGVDIDYLTGNAVKKEN